MSNFWPLGGYHSFFDACHWEVEYIHIVMSAWVTTQILQIGCNVDEVHVNLGGSGSNFRDFLGSLYIPLGGPWEILRAVMSNGYGHDFVQFGQQLTPGHI